MAADPLCPVNVVPTLSVPLLGRWVTTSIYRLDLNESVPAWPTDLQFRLRVKPDLTAWDGASVNLTGFREPEYSTSRLNLYVNRVTSEAAAALVDGVYDACLNSPVCEVAPDAFVAVSFSGPVDVDAILDNMVVMCPSLPAAVAVRDGRRCDGYGWSSYGSCVNVTFDGTLPTGETCTVMLPPGTRYHELAGPVVDAPTAKVTGLLPFTFPYLRYGLTSLAANQYALLLRHGLQAETTSGGDPVAALQAALRIDPQPEGPVTLRRTTAATLVLDGPWGASDRFSLSFGPEADGVRDGFGLPFLGADQEALSLATAPFPPMLYDYASGVGHSSTVNFGDSTYSADWTVVARNDSTYQSSVVSFWAIENVRDLQDAMRVADAGVSSATTALGAPTASRSLDPTAVNQVQTFNVPTDPLFGTSGIFFRRLSMCVRSTSRTSSMCYVRGSDAFVVRTPWAVHTLGTTLFVTNTETGEPVAGADVSLTCRRGTSTSGTTDAAGLLDVEVLGDSYSSNCDVIVSQGGALFLVRNMYFHASVEVAPEARIVAAVTTARRLHRAGDDVHFKGYLHQFEGKGSASLPSSVTVRGTWRRSGSVEERTTSVVVPVDPVRGSFDGVLPILENAEYGEALLSVEETVVEEELGALDDPKERDDYEGGGADGGAPDVEPALPTTDYAAAKRGRPGRLPVRRRGRLARRSAVASDEPYYGGGSGGDYGGDYGYGYGYRTGATLGSTTVVVADPRIPTATMDVSIEEPVYRKHDGVTLQGQLSTYIGTPIAGATVDVVWRVTGIPTVYPYDYDYGYVDYSLTARSSFAGNSLVSSGSSDDAADEEHSGTFQVTSDETGAISHSFVLPSNVEVPTNDRLTFEVSYIGPTRELVTADASVAIRESELEVSLNVPAAHSVIPGQSFVVHTNVLDVDGSPVSGASIDLRMYRLAASAGAFNLSLSAEAQEATLVASQTVSSSGDNAGVATVFQLPGVGVHAVVASTVDEDEHLSVRTASVGRSAASWAAAPLASWTGGSVSSARSEYSDGEEVTVSVLPPFAGGCSMFVRFGRTAAQVLPCPAAGELTDVSVGTMGHEECGEFCSVTVAFVAPRGAKGLADDVPVRASFDAAEPVALVRSVQVSRTVPNPFALDGEITVSPSAASANPGDEVFVTVEGVGAGAEVHLFVVDEKILDLSPHPLLNVADVLHAGLTRFYFSLSAFVSENLLIPHAYVTALVSMWDRRVRAFPWVTPSSYYWSNPDPLDVSDEDFFAAFYAPLTDFPWGWSFKSDASEEGAKMEFGGVGGAEDDTDALAPPTAPMMMRMDGAGESDDLSSDGGSPGGAGAPAVSSPAVRGEAVYVALSATAVADPSGLVRFRVVLPDNLSTFKLRALAVSADGSAYGSAEGELVSSRYMNLEPSIPRIARVSDVFVAGTTVTLATMDQGSRTVRLSLVPDCGNLELLVPQVQEVELTSTTPVRVEWALRASRVGLGNLRLSVEDDSLGVVDTVDATLEVQGWQEPVTIGTSFALRADAATEGVDLPAHVPGSGSLTVAAGVGRLPAAKAIAAKLLEAVSSERLAQSFPPSAMELTGAAVPLASLAGYRADAVAEDMKLARAGARVAADHLQRYTNPSPWSPADRVGLVMYPPRTTWWWQSQQVPRPNLQLNAFALFVHRLLLTSGLADGFDSLVEGSASAGSLAAQWTAAVNRAVGLAVADAKEAGREYVSDLDGLAAAYLALGVRHRFASDVAGADFDYVSIETLVAQRERMSYQSRAMLALALAYDEGYAAERDALVATLTNSLRIQGRTAYVARDNGASSSDVLASARLLAVQSILQRVGSSSGLPWDKLANGVASLGESSDAREAGYYFPVSRSAQENAFALFSLVTYDAAVGSTDPDATALVVLSSNSMRYVVVDEDFTSPADPPVSETISLASLAEAARLATLGGTDRPSSVVLDGGIPQTVDAALQFGAAGQAGELSFTLTMDYVPAALPESPVYRGFTVTKVIRALDPATGQPVGEPLTAARAGDQVVVTIDVYSPDDVADVLLVDPVPGALEPVSQDGAPADVSGSGDRMPWGWWWYQTWSLQQAKRDAVHAHSSWFRAGSHTLQYIALVVTPGTFVLPPTKVYAMMQPELLGLSAGGSFVAQPVTAAAQQVLQRAESDAGAGDVRCFEPAEVPALDEDFPEDDGTTLDRVGKSARDDSEAAPALSGGIIALLVIAALLLVGAGSAAMYVVGQRRNGRRVRNAATFVEDPVAARKAVGAASAAAAADEKGAAARSPSPAGRSAGAPAAASSSSARAARRHRSRSRPRSPGATKHHRRPLIT